MVDKHTRDSATYTLLFAAAVSVVCALLVAVAAVVLQPMQQASARSDMQKNVLLAAGLIAPGAEVGARDVRRIFAARVEPRLVDFGAGTLVPAERIDAAGYDQRRARDDPATSRPAPSNSAGIARLPIYGLVYLIHARERRGTTEQVVLPIEGLAMWGQVYGFIALAADGNTVQGLAFYEQRETPGLGGEIGNPEWQALWRGRKAYDAQWEPQLRVVKGSAGPPEDDPHRVDALSGATVTSSAITRIVWFWLSDDGYGRWLKTFRQEGSS